MADPYYLSTIVQSGIKLDEIYSYVSRLEQNDQQPIGFLWDPSSNSPTLQRIDINGNNFNPPSGFFDKWSVTGGMRKCVRNRTTGKITYGTNNRGDGLLSDGSMGDVLVEIPTAWCRIALMEGDCREYITIPYNSEETRYSIHPSAVQRGGIARNKIYVGAKEASLLDDNGTLKFQSINGMQPCTGGNVLKSLNFTTGVTAFTVGETVTGASSTAHGIVMGFHLTSGSWGGTAAGIVYLRQTSGTFTSTESLTGSVSGAATAGSSFTSISLTLDQAENYAKAIGSGFGICNIYTYSYLTQLMLTEFGTFDIQTALGQGVSTLPQGTGFAGVLTGADSVDTNLSTNGTGIGSGSNGHTPVTWRGIENFFGNVTEFVAGLNFSNTGAYNILTPDGNGTISAVLAPGSYVIGVGVIPTVDGYISRLQSDTLGALAFIPSAVAGSSLTYLCDRYYPPGAATTIVRHGGYWYGQTINGPCCMFADQASTYSNQTTGARIEYIPQS